MCEVADFRVSDLCTESQCLGQIERDTVVTSAVLEFRCKGGDMKARCCRELVYYVRVG